jgi:murein DD-endopeptidase MepM/ murein hydrolase activator NlpD
LSSASVTVGQQVSRGATVAMSGTTGASTGCHLQFEVMINGEVVDPTGWL